MTEPRVAKIIQSIQPRTISPIAENLMELARRAVDRLKREGEVDIREWADRIAAETATADD